jgi:transcriptional regulator with XRE-family HTH domain
MLNAAELLTLRALTLRKGERNRVRIARALERLTQIDLAELTGIKQAQISAIENGRDAGVSVETASCLAQFFGCTIEDLFPLAAAAPREQNQEQQAS